MILVLFIRFSLCWGPYFHQNCAAEFAHEYLPNIPKDHYDSFLLGNVYIDSLPRKKYHIPSSIIELFKPNEDKNTSMWWFKTGMLLHLTVDVFGHYGGSHGFLPFGIPRHYFAEFVVCSAMIHMKTFDKIELTDEMESFLSSLQGSHYKMYRMIVKAIGLFGKLPFHRFIGSLEADKCGKCNEKRYAMNNLLLHIEGIKNAMWDTLVEFNNGNFNDSDTGKFVKNEITNIMCC